jgi:hypothetical protein
VGGTVYRFRLADYVDGAAAEDRKEGDPNPEEGKPLR